MTFLLKYGKIVIGVKIVFWDEEENYGGTRTMEPMYLSIRTKETGTKIKKLLMEKGYSVRDIQDACGFENPQAIYKWISGRSLPSLDNFIILSRLLHTNIEDILVVDGDVVRLWGCFKPTVQ